MPALEKHPATGPTAAASRKKGVQCIRLFLGDYLANPALLLLPVPFPAQRRVTAQWAFDKNGRLIEIFVDKKLEGS
jgi:hypothetical protein